MKKMNMLSILTVGLLSVASVNAADYSMVPTNDFEVIKAKIIDSNPSNFTINVKSLSNLGADQEAPVFSVYTSSSKPSECADFRNLEISYKKPEKYLRQFDLSDKPDVVKAIENSNCVAIKNIPSS